MTTHNHSILLVTGGLGFIGINFIDFMLKKGNGSFRILDNLSVGTVEDLEVMLAEHGQFKKKLTDYSVKYFLSTEPLHSVIELIIGDIRSPEDCLKATRGAAAVLHLAAQSGVPTSVEDPLNDCETNVVGTVNLLEACRNNGPNVFVFASSGAPLGEVEPPINEKKLPRPISPYGASKLAGEAYCNAYYKTFGINTASLRFGNVYGPRSKHKTSVVAKFFNNALQGKVLEIYGDGSQTRDFIYTEDLCNAIYLAFNSLGFIINFQPSIPLIITETAGEVFQIATHRETTVDEIALKIKELVSNNSEQKVEIWYGEKRLGDVKRNFSDISKAKSKLGFEPHFDIDKGLLATWDYYRKNSLVDTLNVDQSVRLLAG